MRFFPCLFFALLFMGSLHAQNPNRVTIKGTIIDSSSQTMAYATVMLLTPKDSTLVNFSRSDENGAFVFKNVNNAPYIFKISYVGYIPHQQYLPASGTGVEDLGNIILKPINAQLMEVVIKEARSTLSIRGDTIEYDAASFKVPPGSSVEDLLRRLPGVEVDADGNIKAQGQDIRRVFVDGKSFFGDDPKAATKNLGAETISKVQVYDGKSEQAQLTGIDDGKKEKTMNLELKEEYKKGAFGKATIAAGTENRLAARGNYNRFNSKMQLSFIGYGNNINETGVNWDDYSEFKGQNTFNDFDNGDFGFSSGGGMRYYSSDDNGIINNFDGRGFTENYGGGTNFNFDNKKTKFNTSYFYNQTDRNLDQYSSRETFLDNNTIFNTDTTASNDFRGSHSIASRIEHNIDSSNLIIAKANFRFSTLHSGETKSQQFFNTGEILSNALDLDNSSENDSRNLSTAAIFRHRFEKKGRSFALSGGYNDFASTGADQLFSLNQFFEANTFTEQIRQLNNNHNTGRQIKSSALYTEPLSKVLFLESFYNFSKSDNTVDRQVLDPEQGNQRNDLLSVYYDNKVQYNRLGSSIRYSNNGFNASIGLAAQQIRLQGSYAIAKGEPELATPIDRKFNNYTPNIEVSYDFPNNYWLSGDYSYEIQEPSLNDLQPVPNVNNPAFRIEGNPDLNPERAHNLGLNINHWDPATFTNFGAHVNYKRYDSQIIYSQIIEQIDSVGIRTTTRPLNIDKGDNWYGWLWTNFPIIKTKLTFNANGHFNIGKTPTFVNAIENITDTKGFGIGGGFNITPNSDLLLNVSGNYNLQNIRYSIASEQNQNIFNYGLNTSIKWQFIPKTFFESNFNYSRYINDRFGFNREIPIWNASVRRLLGEKNRIEIRLAAFDLLNKRVNISQSASQNFVYTNVAPTLARYYMLSLSYNIRGYEAKVKKNGWW